MIGCVSPPSIPDNVLPREQMASILAEIHVQQSYVSRLNFSTSDSSQVAYHTLEKSIFKQFKIDTGAYKRSFIFYSENPEYMADIYKKVVENIEKKVADNNKKAPKGKPTR
jgi:Domain of unknown function (DUF4296)